VSRVSVGCFCHTRETVEHNIRIFCFGYVQQRRFGQSRSGSVLVPDDCGALPSAHIQSKLATDRSILLYEAEIDQGKAWRGIRLLMPIMLVLSLPFVVIASLCKTALKDYGTNGDESCCWLRKEYSTRTFLRIYSNRIEVNTPSCRIFGLFGCGSWNSDSVINNQFDRGAFGFRRVNAGVISYLCCLWPVYGWTMARQRCQCNGPPWHGTFMTRVRSSCRYTTRFPNDHLNLCFSQRWLVVRGVVSTNIYRFHVCLGS
jgi:hypothetical protein